MFSVFHFREKDQELILHSSVHSLYSEQWAPTIAQILNLFLYHVFISFYIKPVFQKVFNSVHLKDCILFNLSFASG